MAEPRTIWSGHTFDFLTSSRKTTAPGAPRALSIGFSRGTCRSSANGYIYAGDDPINAIDPTGLLFGFHPIRYLQHHRVARDITFITIGTIGAIGTCPFVETGIAGVGCIASVGAAAYGTADLLRDRSHE
jgi:hypothetical protein